MTAKARSPTTISPAASSRAGGPTRCSDVVVGAGFEVVDVGEESGDDDGWVHLLATRSRTLPDLVGPGMRLLMCGLNPSLYAADAGVGFARPGNRFWPAALAAGIVLARPRSVDTRSSTTASA